MLWLKSFHIIFVVTWFAGLFYLPRLFVYHLEVTDAAGRKRFCTMESRLLAITTLGASLALIFGLALLMSGGRAYWLPWLQVKLTLVALLVGYHFWCAIWVGRFARDAVDQSARWFRVFNEIPALLLMGIVLLVVLKPF